MQRYGLLPGSRQARRNIGRQGLAIIVDLRQRMCFDRL